MIQKVKQTFLKTGQKFYKKTLIVCTLYGGAEFFSQNYYKRGIKNEKTITKAGRRVDLCRRRNVPSGTAGSENLRRTGGKVAWGQSEACGLS